MSLAKHTLLSEALCGTFGLAYGFNRRKINMLKLVTLISCSFLMLIAVLIPISTKATSTSENEPFATIWNRLDEPVQKIPGIGRGYTWGPVVMGSEIVASEPYNGVIRQVKYFDKARMEINNPSANPDDLFYITSGLLVKELVTGQRQDGDNLFTPLTPSNIPVAGDPNENGANLIAPTYASFKNVVTFIGSQNGKSAAISSAITAKIAKDGTLSTFSPPENRLVTGYDPVTQHNIADVFVNFGAQRGLLWNGSNYVQGEIFAGNPTYVLGRPVTEPYWTRAVVAGVEKDVMVQLFERRVLTYTPSNPPAFKVEMGNVGQHYYHWRYVENSHNSSTTSTPAPNPIPVTASPGFNFGANALLNLYDLPQLGAYTQNYEVSSHDPAARNIDYANYLYHDNTGYVIFDSQGAGTVYRIWMTHKPFGDFDKIGRIQFYLDNESTPRLDQKIGDFFSGKIAPFLAPLVGNNLVSSGGYFSYLPITFANRLKIVTTEVPGYYQVTYQKLSGPQHLDSFTGKEDYNRLLKLLSNPGLDPKPANSTRQVIRGDDLLKGGKELKLSGVLKGPAVISALKLKLDLTDPSVMSRTYIRIKCDGRELAQVDAPLDYFFGSGAGEKYVAGLMAGIEPKTHEYYFYFPMPFRSDAQITLFNSSADSVAAHWEITLDSDTNGTLINSNTGYFNATFKQEKETPIGQDYVLLNTTGRGRYVGTVMHIYGDRSSMEGNERIYIDGSGTPQQYGTGFEDYFNAAYAFSQGPFTQPLHGSAAKLSYSNPSNFIGLIGYRFLLGDAVTFNSSLTVGFEQGQMGKDIPVKGQIYSSLAFWYGQETVSLEQTDALELTEPISENDHNYSNSGVDFKGSLSSSFEGVNNKQIFTSSGYRLRGGSEFTVKINPNNAGVILRRRFDYNDLNQQANIYIDGQLVERWFSPGQNQVKRWREEDFVIPVSFTQGKSSLKVRVEVIVEPAPWSEFSYQVFSLKPGLGYLPDVVVNR